MAPAGHEDGGDDRTCHHFRYDATGLRGKRMRLMDDLPTSDAGWPQEPLIGLTDVICLDDTPDVMHNLHVHPVGQPDTVAIVEFRQLDLYDDQAAPAESPPTTLPPALRQCPQSESPHNRLRRQYRRRA